MSTQTIEMIVDYGIIAIVLFAIRIAYLKSAIKMHRKERLAAAGVVANRGTKASREVNLFMIHHAWLVRLANSPWKYFVNQRKLGGIDECCSTEKNALALIKADRGRTFARMTA